MNLKSFWVVDHVRNDTPLRGPFKTAEAAVAVRREMENNATNEQNEKWNLWVVSQSKYLTEAEAKEELFAAVQKK